MILSKVDRVFPDRKLIEQAAGFLKQGGLVAFPTETVYGLGADGLNAEACKKIYQAKGRPSDNPLILHIANEAMLLKIVRDIPPAAEKVMKAYWPGPITIIFPKASCVPEEITGGFDTVAVRFPSDPLAQQLILTAGVPVAAPSANSSGKPSPTRASHVAFDLGDKVDMIIDGGPTEVGLESTILDTTVPTPVILRPGAITYEMLKELLGEVQIDPALSNKPSEELKPKAPGMKYKHYSPKAKVILVKGQLPKVVQRINALSEEEAVKGKKIGIMATDQTIGQYKAEVILSVGDRTKPETIGANLYKMLRKFDFLGVDVVFAEVFEETGEGAAIMNRLNKAAGYCFITAE